LGDELDFRVSVQYTRQSSTGDELIGDFNTDSGGVQLALGWQDFIFKVAGTVTSNDFGVQKPWGGTPSYLSIQRLDFDRAGERAYLLGVAYNADRWIKGLSGFATFAFGSDAEVAETGIDLPDRNEFDFTIDYKPKNGILRGFWIRARANFIATEGDDEDIGDIRDFRVIVNYPIRLF
ncbi:MAG: OprD family outer membrane porin, partial [Pseudomonadales bacterium]